jgi:type II secretory pathway pseudopilin PulG
MVMEENQPQQLGGDASPERVGKIKTQHKALTWVLIVLVVLLLAGAGYLWWQLQSAKKTAEQLDREKQQLQSQVDAQGEESDESAAGGTEETACTYTPGATLKDNIKAALDTQNTAAFATYTTDPVKYILAASEFGGDITPTEAATSLEYTHSATAPWDFNLAPATIAGYDAGFYTDYFEANTLVGKAASGMVVAFEFSCDGSKISDIFVAADEDLL